MFIRFRKTPNDGFRPRAAGDGAAYIACRWPYPSIDGKRITCKNHCRTKPRCRWRIGKNEKLQPYRLKVVLAENKRVNGKVKQETVAVLGSIDATWLETFWQDTPENLRTENWKLRSLQARVGFWKIANERLARLANRLGPDMKRFRIAVHKQVPWPKEAERKELEIIEAEADGELWFGLYKMTTRIIEEHDRAIEHATSANVKLRSSALREIGLANEAKVKAAELRRKP